MASRHSPSFPTTPPAAPAGAPTRVASCWEGGVLAPAGCPPDGSSLPPAGPSKPQSSGQYASAHPERPPVTSSERGRGSFRNRRHAASTAAQLPNLIPPVTLPCRYIHAGGRSGSSPRRPSRHGPAVPRRREPFCGELVAPTPVRAGRNSPESQRGPVHCRVLPACCRQRCRPSGQHAPAGPSLRMSRWPPGREGVWRVRSARQGHAQLFQAMPAH